MKPKISVAVCLCLALVPLELAHAQNSSKQGRILVNLQLVGTTSLGPQGPGATTEIGMEVRRGPKFDRSFDKQITGTISPARVPSSHVPRPEGSPVLGTGTGFLGFNGLAHVNQRLAGTGIYTNTQFTLEPPDNTIAVSDTHIVEAVNTALVVRNKSGAVLAGPVALNQFFGLAPAIDRVTGTLGDFTADPKLYFDSDTQRWFLTLLQIDVAPATGAFLPGSHIEIGVSQGSNPIGVWYHFRLDVTNDGADGTPSHPGCPCFGDQPLIGADANGFYISTNEFPIFASGFNGAQVYAFSKSALVGGALPPAVHFDNLPLAEGPAYSLQPATTPPGGTHAPDTEYFLSALDFTATLDNRIAAWALTGTGSLNSANSKLTLTSVVIGSQVYGQPPDAQQKPGPTPLADLLAAGLLGKPAQEHLGLIAANDDRMQQVVYAGGKLWLGLNTVVKTPNGPTRVGIAYFIVTPSWNGNTFSASIAKQGYVSVNQNNVLFPAIGVNAQGQGAMTFTLVGSDYFPSAAYALIDAVNGAGSVRLAGPGAAPNDGFTGYASFNGRTGRWGDYSTATADSSGAIWMVTEYIPNAPRTLLANWGSFISKVTP